MVVPMENFISGASSKSKKYIGNGLVLHLKQNNSTIHIVGNECKIKIDVNNGLLKVVGNSCRVQVFKGNGEIIYNGNEGRIRLGSEVDEKNVTYVGNEGKIFKELPSSKTKENQKKKETEVPLEKTRSSSNYTLNIVNKSDKHFSLGESMFTLTPPSMIAVPNISESVLKIRRVKK